MIKKTFSKYLTRIFLVSAALVCFFALANSTFAADNLLTSTYIDADRDGQVDHLKWTFDTNITQCTYSAADWSTIDTAGTINITAVTGIDTSDPEGTGDGACDGTDAVVYISVTANADITGGATDPQNTYTNNANNLQDSGNISTILAQTNTDAAAPAVVSLTIKDPDFDGLIDTVDVTWSENVDTDDSAAPVIGDFGTLVLPDGQSVTAASITDPAGATNIVTLSSIADQSTINTSSGSTAIDGITNEWTDGTNATSNPDDNESIVDSAAPMIASLTIKDPDFDGLIDTVDVTWSENVDTDDGAAPVIGDFGTLLLPDGQTVTAASITDPAGATNIVTLSSIADQSTINTSSGSTAINGITNEWTDGTNATSNPDDNEAVVDSAAPVIASLTIKDPDFDGLIDTVDVTWSENVDTDDGAAPVIGDFGTLVLPDGQSVTAASITDPAGATNIVTLSSIADQSTINTSSGSTAIDGITNEWTDGTNATSNPDDNEAVVDSAAPMIASLTIKDPDFDGLIDTVDVTWSENVDTDDGAAPVIGDFGTLLLPDGQTVTAASITDPAGATNIVTLSSISDQGSINTSVGSTAINGITNEWTDGTNATSNPDDNEAVVDSAAPMIATLTIQDPDFDGLIDTIDVTWSENVDTDDGAAPVIGDFGTILLPDGQSVTAASITDPGGVSNSVTLSSISDQLTINTAAGSTAINGITNEWTDGTNATSNPDDNEAVVDIAAPIVINVTPNDTLITEADIAADAFYLDIDYSEAMAGGSSPTVSYTPDIAASGTLTLSGTSAWGDADTYQSYYDVGDGDEEQTLTGIGITGATDASASANVQIAYSGGGEGVVVDNLNPTLAPVSIASDNADPTWAKVGDTVTISFTSSEALSGLPTVTIDGNAADSVVNTGGNNYTADRLMQTGDTEAPVAFTIDFNDANGNAGLQVTATTDASSVTFDETAPLPTDPNMAVSKTENAGDAGIANPTDVITIVWDAATDGHTDLASADADFSDFGGGNVPMHDDGFGCDVIAGNDVWCADYTVVGGSIDDDGVASANVTITDATDDAGNVASDATDSTAISIDNEVPSIATPGSFTITLDNNSNGVANVSDQVTYNNGTPGVVDGDAWEVDITTLTGDANATNAGSPYTVIAGTLNGAIQFTETVTDDAGNSITGNTTALNVNSYPLLDSTSVSLSNTRINQTTGFTIMFTPIDNWPVDGKFVIDFPAEFNVSGLDGNDVTGASGVDSTITVTDVTGQTVTFTRDGGGAVVGAGTPVRFRIDSGTNGPTAGLTGTFLFEMQENDGTLINIDDAVAGVTLTAPTGGGGGSFFFEPGAPAEPGEEVIEAPEIGLPLPEAFNDIMGHWAEDYINEAQQNDYVDGYSDGSFRPDNYINRAEAAKLIAMWLNDSISNCSTNPFSDVSCSEWYGRFVAYLKLQGVVDGFADGTFGPGNNLSRAEALKMLIFVKGLEGTDISGVINPFSDIGGSDWYYNIILIGYKLNIVDGYADGTFGPNNPVTRAEFTKMFVETLMNN